MTLGKGEPAGPAQDHRLWDIAAVNEFLRGVATRNSAEAVAPIISALKSMKAAAVAAGDETRAKEIWCLETALCAQGHYLSAFEEMRAGAFYPAWCSLERAEIELGFLKPHASSHWSAFRLDFIEEAVARWQRLFPYRLFMSPEFVETEKRCSICQQPVSLRAPCGHEVGEVYGGELCCRIVTSAQMLSMSFVDEPVQKYSVPFTTDPRTGAQRDQYDYTIVRYVRRGVRSAFDGWQISELRRRHPHDRFRHVGRNDPCPCESGKKYKRCCLPESGVLRPHVQVIFDVPPPPDLPPLMYNAN